MKKGPTFKDNGMRRILCPACGGFLIELSIEDKNIVNKKCTCGCVSVIYPPRKERLEDGFRVIRFGPGEGTFTADLTNTD